MSAALVCTSSEMQPLGVMDGVDPLSGQLKELSDLLLTALWPAPPPPPGPKAASTLQALSSINTGELA